MRLRLILCACNATSIKATPWRNFFAGSLARGYNLSRVKVPPSLQKEQTVRFFSPLLASFLVYLASLLVSLTAVAQIGGPLPAVEQRPVSREQESNDSEERLILMKKAAEAITLASESLGKPSTPIPILQQPVLRFNDPARNHQDGTLWLFGGEGRPAAAVELWANDVRQPQWFYSIVSMFQGRLRGSWDGSVRWVPQVAGVTFRPVPTASPPAMQAVARRRQLKMLARQFAAYEVFRGDRSELRLLAKPLHLYTDDSQKVLDGGVFLFTHGTNPELLLLIEAVQGDEQLQWQYAFAPSGSAEFHGLHDDQEVWTLPEAPGVTGAATDPYWLFPRTLAAENIILPTAEE
jgi:hypothetical protein